MTDTTPGPDDRPGTAGRIRAIAAALTAAGLDAQVHDTRGVLDITATLHRPGCKDIEIIYDEDHYAQVSWWNDPGATPAQVAFRPGLPQVDLLPGFLLVRSVPGAGHLVHAALLAVG